MTRCKRKSELLTTRYNERQGELRVGDDYQPAIRAVRGEAPAISRCCRSWFPQHGREIHTLSSSETIAALVAHFHPRLVDCLEQRCLPIEPERHPVSLYPEMSGRSLPGLPGTPAVAERCGLFQFHPKFAIDDGGERYHVPVPLVGDLLLILRDDEGLYAVNWTVKVTDAGFRERLTRRPAKRQSLRSQEEAEARFRIELECYAAAGISTKKVIKTTFDKMFVANLKQCAGWLHRPVSLDPASQSAMVEAYRSIIGTGTAPLDLLELLRHQFECTRQDCLIVFHRAVWFRQLRVDLFRPILFNIAMEAEKEDPLVKYAEFFARSSK